jgi:hypothetical protein
MNLIRGVTIVLNDHFTFRYIFLNNLTTTIRNPLFACLKLNTNFSNLYQNWTNVTLPVRCLCLSLIRRSRDILLDQLHDAVNCE